MLLCKKFVMDEHDVHWFDDVPKHCEHVALQFAVEQLLYFIHLGMH